VRAVGAGPAGRCGVVCLTAHHLPSRLSRRECPKAVTRIMCKLRVGAGLGSVRQNCPIRVDTPTTQQAGVYRDMHGRVPEVCTTRRCAPTFEAHSPPPSGAVVLEMPPGDFPALNPTQCGPTPRFPSTPRAPRRAPPTTSHPDASHAVATCARLGLSIRPAPPLHAPVDARRTRRHAATRLPCPRVSSRRRPLLSWS
jgi:hypothetical protein